jgi:hypothetical protein
VLHLPLALFISFLNIINAMVSWIDLTLNSEARVLCSSFYQKLLQSDAEIDMFWLLLAPSVGLCVPESFAGSRSLPFCSLYCKIQQHAIHLSCPMMHEESGTAAVGSPRGGTIHSTQIWYTSTYEYLAPAAHGPPCWLVWCMIW